jgi:hypothetical protein
MAVAAVEHGWGADLQFFLEFVGADGTRHREPLEASVTARLEEAQPVRRFRWAKGDANFPGSWWSSTVMGHVGFESWLERDLIRTARRVTT